LSCFLCTLYCQFIWIAICLLPLRYFLTFICPVSCVLCNWVQPRFLVGFVILEL
jgi:hypothetical protein